MVSHLTKSENMNLWPCVLGGIGVGIAFTLGYKEIFSLEDSNEKPKYAAPSKFLYFITGLGEAMVCGSTVCEPLFVYRNST